MNIQDRERDVLKNLPSALGKIHLLKQPCQDNTELNISLSMLNTFMIQTEKQLKTYFTLPHPTHGSLWIVKSQWPVTFLVSKYQPNIAVFGFPAHKEKASRRTKKNPNRCLIYAF